MRHGKRILPLIALALLAGIMMFAYTTYTEQPVAGTKTVTIEVLDHAGASTTYAVTTDAAFLQQAMEEAEGLTFACSDGPYGASVHTVNGLRADYTLDGAYWGFFVNGEYCTYGITQQPVEDGDHFRIVYTPA